MNILILSARRNKQNWGHQLFLNEVARQHYVLFYGKGYPNYKKGINVKDILNRYFPNPDMILTCGSYTKNANFPGLGDIKIFKAHIENDYAINFNSMNVWLKENNYDIIFAISTRTEKLLNKHKVSERVGYLPYSVDTYLYIDDGLDRTNDVLIAYRFGKPNLVNYPMRRKVFEYVSSLNLNSKLSNLKSENPLMRMNMVNALKTSKINITSNNVLLGLSMRYTETMACGCLLFTDSEPLDFERCGYNNDQYVVIYNGLEDLRDKLNYYLIYDNERKSITDRAFEFVNRYHSNKVRVQQMTKIIKEELNV